MKIRCKTLLVALGLLTIVALPTLGTAAEVLSFTPPVPCKRPPKSPPPKLLDQFFPELEWETDPAAYGVNNAPFETNVDINGDGWCDWVSLSGMAPHYYNETPPMKNFLFLGTKNGWRHFGKMKDSRMDLPLPRKEGPSVLTPDEYVASFQDPLFVYALPTSPPYVVVSRTTKDIFSPKIPDVDIYLWNNDLDMLELLTLKARAPIILFIRDNACKNPTLIPFHNNSPHQTLEAICEGRTRYCESWGECSDEKTPLCDEWGNCDEYSVWKAP